MGKTRRPLQHVLFFIWTLTLLVYISCIGIKNIFRYNRIQSEYELTLMALKKGQEKNLILKKQLTLMTHPFYWEQEIKKRLGYVKEGEMVYKITSLL